MDSDKKKLMLQIQSCGFAMLEAHLYLDSHPTCKKGLEYFTKHKEHYEAYVKEYEEKYGPITASSAAGEKRWEWVQTPFPWEWSEN